jgi:hypothetical protein
METKPLKWYHRVFIGLAISAIPLFAVISALTYNPVVTLVNCQTPDGTTISTMAVVDLDQEGNIHIVDDKMDVTLNLNGSVCMIGVPPKPTIGAPRAQPVQSERPSGGSWSSNPAI